MMHHTPHPSSNNNDDAFDLSQIFIGREHQLALFNIYLDRWRRLIYDFKSDGDLVAAAPSPNNKIQGLVVLLYGRSGFGKTTLLRKYRDIALQENQSPLLSRITVSKVIDWEFAVEGKRSLFNPPQGKGLDAPEYFKVLCGQLAIALGKEPKEFKEYQKAVTALEETRKKAEGVLESLRNDDRYDWLRGLAVEAIITAVGAYAPASKAVLDNPSVKKGVDAVAKLTQEQISRVLTKLHDKLGAKLDDYLDSALRLGLALGCDLAKFAKNFPLLIFFDTYEEIDEGDMLLRIIMGAAGLRVGWVIAGRNKLWTGLEQTEYSLDTEYGYKEIVPSDRGMAVDFNAGGVGAFTLSDINELFSQLCKKVQYEPPLPKPTRNGTKRILKATLGIPLAVKIAAGLYMETADLDTVIEEVEGKRKVVDKMVHRYLIHTRIDQSERAKLYGLALLRRANQPAAVSAALDLTSEEAKTGYPATLSRLQRRYSFIFTEKEEPSLHQEVRHFLRLWLLQHYKEPHIQAINEPLKEAHEAALKKLEELRHYASLKERLQDDEWVGIYLDLAQQQFWIDPVEGMRYLLPFMIAAAIYYRTINEEARRVGQFFVKEMKHPYLSWWRWADKCLKLPSNFDPMDEELVALEQLTELASQRCLTFPSPIPDCRKELEAALWWRLGEAYELIDAYQALRWYEIALACLGHEIRLKESASRVCHMIGDQLEEEKKYSESISFFDRAITLNPDDFFTYYSRGLLHAKLGNLSQAIQDFERIIALRTKDAFAYLCRGYAYDDLGDYSTAMQDFERALALDPDNASGYYHRGVIHAKLGNYSSAIQDYDRALDLESDYANVYIGRGIAYADLQDYPRAIQDYDRAISLNPDEPVAYYNRSYAFLLIKDLQRAQSDFSFYSRLNPTDINAAWMTQWLGMGKTRPTVEMVEHLEKVEEIDPETYVAYVCQGLVLGLRGKLKEGLAKLEQALSLDSEAWDAYFWQGMLLAHYYKGRYEKARKALEKALELEMPPVLLTPLYWLEKERSDFFEQYARPLLEYYQV